MKRRETLWLAVALTTVLAGLPGCGGDETAPDREPTVDAVLALAGQVAGLIQVSADYYTVVEVGYGADNDGPKGLALHPGVGDTLLADVLTCPVVYKEAPEKSGSMDTLVVDFGDGCMGQLDSVLTSGDFHMYVTNKPPASYDVALDIDNLLRGDTVHVQGDVALDGEQSTVQVDSPSLQYVLGSTVIAETTGSLLLERLSDPELVDGTLCLDWSAEAGGGTASWEGTVWDFSLQTPVGHGACCRYPTSGTVHFQADGFVPVLVDFGDGTCDAEAEITIGSRIQTVSLGD